MSDEKEDLELEALQRRLDDAFATTRPRRDFEDELWLKMQARRPATSRLRDAFAGLVAGFREAPAVPIGAVAVLLIIVIGIGVIASGGLHPNQNATSGALSQSAPDLASGEFGRLPTPRLDPNAVEKNSDLALSAGPQPPSSLGPMTANLYFGPANLRWTGELLPLAPAPVYRYSEPTSTDADQFAASLGGAPTNSKAPGYLGAYSAEDFTISVLGSVPQLPREPDYVLTPTTSFGGPGRDPQTVARNFLDRYSLAPTSPSPVLVEGTGDVTRVVYPRSLPLGTPSGVVFFLVDWSGERYGTEVDLRDGQIRSASGPIPVRLDAANYRLISNDQAVQQALRQSPAAAQSLQPKPTVALTKVELVYALAVSNGQGFYEPAYLFSGTFQYNGQTYTKRVLVPLVDPSQRT